MKVLTDMYPSEGGIEEFEPGEVSNVREPDETLKCDHEEGDSYFPHDRDY